jgi:cell division transport system permease protein
MSAWLQQHRYALGVTVRRLLGQPFSSLANVLVMALALALPLVGSAVLVSVQPISKHLSVTPELTIFLSMDAPPGAAAQVAQRIRADFDTGVQDVQVMARDEALAELKSNPAWAEALTVLPSNPLPDAVVARLAQGDDLSGRASALALAMQKWNFVDRVQLDSVWVQRLETLLQFARIGLFFLAACVAVVVLATVFNTVRMQALSQREEIGVARLLGATESFVRRPFLYLGALTGGAAALFAVGVAALLLAPLNNALLGLARSYGTEFVLRLPAGGWLLTAIVSIAALGALSARWSVTRNTRF